MLRFLLLNLLSDIYFELTSLDSLRDTNPETDELEVIHLFKFHHERIFWAQLHQNKRADLQSMLHLDYLKLVVLLALVEKAEHDTVTLICRREHSNFVAQPKQLDRSLHIAHQIVKDI